METDAQMAANLRQKLPPSTVLYINDVVQEAVTTFMGHFSKYGPVFPTKNAADVVANCVRAPAPCFG